MAFGKQSKLFYIGGWVINNLTCTTVTHQVVSWRVDTTWMDKVGIRAVVRNVCVKTARPDSTDVLTGIVEPLCTGTAVNQTPLSSSDDFARSIITTDTGYS